MHPVYKLKSNRQIRIITRRRMETVWLGISDFQPLSADCCIGKERRTARKKTQRGERRMR